MCVRSDWPQTLRYSFDKGDETFRLGDEKICPSVDKREAAVWVIKDSRSRPGNAWPRRSIQLNKGYAAPYSCRYAPTLALWLYDWTRARTPLRAGVCELRILLEPTRVRQISHRSDRISGFESSAQARQQFERLPGARFLRVRRLLDAHVFIGSRLVTRPGPRFT